MSTCVPEHGDELLDILRAWPAKFDALLAAAQEHRLQVLFTEVQAVDGQMKLKRQGFRLDKEYFYPASAIKLCGAVTALEKARRLSGDLDLGLDIQTPLCFHPLGPHEKIFDRDPTNREGGFVTLKHEIRKVFLVSDNDAYNRLYTFVGQAELNERMWAMGFSACRLTHRLGLSPPDRNKDDPRLGGRVEVRDESAPFCLPETRSRLDLGTREGVPGVAVGTGYIEDGRLVEEPMDFSWKNYMTLTDLQDFLVALFFPAFSRSPTSVLSLPPEQRAVLMEAMLQYPSQSCNPQYDSRHYPDDYCKFFLPGLCRVSPKADWRIYNKVGRAYGFSIDNAYIMHLPSGRSFFLSAAIYTNANGIIDDDIYEYDLADLYLADLGEVLARSALSIPLEQTPLIEPKEDCIPSSQWPKVLQGNVGSDELIQHAQEVQCIILEKQSKTESPLVTF
ncbi:hypothetical protein KFL_000500260 [Klebsormidium nitens]|uniref:Beta-lactamase class A catalytic domain-containing protein n=1 Tax=Klebsormidium nitens TaxID=105231 RepID=A0A1Y1HQB6_KLENI|nr:hypothetical protein KFL_000500260 [Klebsormidium nitens]|eukprot:GAQ80273.1 hypothetical protein KFL_000500260 [Klebsormidium nitens]